MHNRKFLAIFVLVLVLLFSGCGNKEYSSDKPEKINPTKSTASTSTTEDAEVQDNKTEHIRELLERYIEGVNLLGDKALVKVFGPVALDDPFYKIYVDTIPANKYGFTDEVRFHIYEGVVDKSFSVTFDEDFSLEALRQFVSLTIFATDLTISYTDAEAEMKKMISGFDGSAPSNVFECTNYFVYITEADIGNGYTINAIHRSESNAPVDKSEFDVMDIGQMTSELNKLALCQIEGTVTSVEMNYPLSVIYVDDIEGNHYRFTYSFSNLLSGINPGQQYHFYFALTGNVIDNVIYGGLRYYE